MARLGDNEKGAAMIVNEDGSGNKGVYLKSLPFYEHNDKYPKIHFVFIDEEGSEYDHGHFEPFNSDTEKRKSAALNRTLHLFGAFMTEENYAKFKEYDYDNDSDSEAMMNAGIELMVPDALELPVDILIAYNAKGFPVMPSYGDVISSKYKKKTLKWTAATKTTLTVVAKTMDDEMASGGGNTSGNEM